MITAMPRWLILSMLLCACHDASPLADAGRDGTRDRASLETGAGEARSRERGIGDGAAFEAGKKDLASADRSNADKSKVDKSKVDKSKTDGGKPDASKPDASKPDAGKADAGNPTGLKTPCQQGPGWTLFRFHYSGGGTSPTIDVWDATCSYSYASSSACNVYAVYPGFGSVSYTSQGFPILTTSEYLRVRFSVAGLSFSKAAVYLKARSYATSSSTYYRIWSPLHGDLAGGPVDNDWVYDWYAMDWTGYLKPTDSPPLTAIQIYAYQGSGQLAVEAVELCVQ
jgi:hypothetical protein